MKKIMFILFCCVSTASAAEVRVDRAWVESLSFAHCHEMQGQPVESSDGVFDCEDFVFAYHAFNGGRVCLLVVWFNAKKNDGHAIAVGLTGGDIWVVEPQTGLMVTSETLEESVALLIDAHFPNRTVFGIDLFSAEE